tara:strand:+ start:636 stop:920 length:285 start_codon:yes stop_codon:yes gene_type:complete
MPIYFHKIVNNTIIVKTAPLSSNTKKIGDTVVQTRQQGAVTFGLLCLMDAKGKSLNPTTLGLKKDQELPDFKLTDQPVMDKDDPKVETGLYWAE